MDPRVFIKLLTLHYNMCTEYYRTRVLRKPVEEVEEEEFEEDVEDDEE
jgi:hypothetical protein